MKRLLFTALLWTVALHAQGRMGAVHSSPSARVSPGASRTSGPVSRGVAPRAMPVTRPGVRISPFTSASGRRPFVGNRNFVAGRGFHHRHFARPFFFVGLNGSCLNGFSTSGFCDNLGYPYYPLYPADAGYSEPAPAPVYDSSSDTQAALSYEVERLSREVDDLRESERQPRPNNDSDQPPVSRPSDMSAPKDPPRALVFKDGHQILVENYVISGNTMWIIDNGRMKKVSLNDIDNAATQKANSESEFRLRH